MENSCCCVPRFCPAVHSYAFSPSPSVVGALHAESVLGPLRDATEDIYKVQTDDVVEVRENVEKYIDIVSEPFAAQGL